MFSFTISHCLSFWKMRDATDFVKMYHISQQTLKHFVNIVKIFYYNKQKYRWKAFSGLFHKVIKLLMLNNISKQIITS